ncbi:MAG: glycosyltransferase family 2 protein, partial [Bacteroidetes bacterium]|nr:glycosyltransferase family 2 protein [Bacteroidota bacterium]
MPCERIRGVYKSRNRSFKKLTFIDKVNGGKADALNAGINISKNQLICSIDVDSIMEPDALLKLVKPFMEETDGKVIGTGGVIRIANSCQIENGQIKKINLPEKFLPRAQVLEYTRAFLMARMAWGKLNGLLLISGALGMFDKEIVIK